MKVFNYHDYINCIHTLRLNAVLQLAEEESKYNIKSEITNNNNDKLIKSILEDKQEMTRFINDFLEPNEKIDSENLIKYTNRSTNKKYNSNKTNLVYKLKDKEIFFIIEHYPSIDRSMPYRVLNSCIDIMQEWSKLKKIKQKNNYPIVVPIIIYTGNKKWKIAKDLKEKRIGEYIFERNKIDLEYNLVDINRLSIKSLLQKRSLFGYFMIIEKSKNKEELRQNLQTIMQNINDKNMLEKIQNIVGDLPYNFLDNSEKEELLKNINIKIEGLVKNEE